MALIKKIAMVTNFPEKEGEISGGIEGVSSALADEFGGQYELHIIAPSGKNAMEERRGYIIHWYKVSRVPGFLGYWTIDRKKIHRLLGVICPDITHFQGVYGWSIGFRRPFVVTAHGILENDILYTDGPCNMVRSFVVRVVENYARTRSLNNIVINPYVTEVMPSIGAASVGAARFWYIPNPVPSRFFDIKRGTSDTEKRVLFVGKVIRIKNVNGVIKAFSLVSDRIPQAKLYIVGSLEDAEYFKECLELIAELGLKENVIFTGGQNREQVFEFLSKSHCLFLFSHQENAPMVIVEAMAAGLPVVATAICGIPYMVKNNETGFLIDSGNEQLAAEKMTLLLEDEQLNWAMSARSREESRANYHAPVVSSKILDAYREIVYAHEA